MLHCIKLNKSEDVSTVCLCTTGTNPCLQVQCHAMQQSRAACMVPACFGMSMQQARLDHGGDLVVCMAQQTDDVSLDAGSNSVMSRQHTAVQPYTAKQCNAATCSFVNCFRSYMK